MPQTQQQQPVPELKHIVKHAGANLAVNDVRLYVMQGELLALPGENSAGKSTLIRVQAEEYPRDKDPVLFNGASIHSAAAINSARAQSVMFIHRDSGLTDWQQAKWRLRQVLQETETDFEPPVRGFELSGTEKSLLYCLCRGSACATAVSLPASTEKTKTSGDDAKGAKHAA